MLLGEQRIQRKKKAIATVVDTSGRIASRKVRFFPVPWAQKWRAVFRIRIRLRLQHFRLNTGTDPDSGFDEEKLEKIHSLEKNLIFFWSKTAIYLSLGLHKGRLRKRRSLHPSKENIQQFKESKHKISEIFSYFCGSFLPSWNRIRILSGFETLVKMSHFYGAMRYRYRTE
jgi:hypothetical protein